MTRDRAQSRGLTWGVGVVLAGLCVPRVVLAAWPGHGRALLLAGLVSLTFGAAVWALRAATPGAAGFGALISFLLAGGTLARHDSLARSGLLPLMLLFVLTFGAGRVGRRRKRALGLGSDEAEEERHGRRASQIVANLGAAGLAASVGGEAGAMMALAALAEATADTLSSEIGSAFGGTPYLLTTLRRVPAGTDGAVSLTGTLVGLAGAAAVAGVGAWRMGLPAREAAIVFGAGTAGLMFDSLLGATVERRGWLGNDLVNFLSTVTAALLAGASLLL